MNPNHHAPSRDAQPRRDDRAGSAGLTSRSLPELDWRVSVGYSADQLFHEILAYVAIGLAAFAFGFGLVAAAIGDMNLAAIFLIAGSIFAQLARSNMNRADALYDRALAAELAEGADDPGMARAA